jgi:transcriptional regulator with XRE-family HTH domain
MARRDPRTLGPAYPVKPKWKDDVRLEMKRRGLQQKDLARKIGCAQGSLSEALSKEARQSSLVPLIHAVFGWAPPIDPHAPQEPPPSPDAIELAHLFDRLPEQARRKLRDDAEFYLRMIDPDSDH